MLAVFLKLCNIIIVPIKFILTPIVFCIFTPNVIVKRPETSSVGPMSSTILLVCYYTCL